MQGYTLRLMCSTQVLYTGEIDRGVQKNIPQFLTALHDSTYHFEMVHSYGLFRRYGTVSCFDAGLWFTTCHSLVKYL